MFVVDRERLRPCSLELRLRIFFPPTNQPTNLSLETIEHILTECQWKLWRIAAWEEWRCLLEQASITKAWAGMPEQVTFEFVLGVGVLKDTENREAVTMMQRITIETAFTIWKLRNAEVIRDEPIDRHRATNSVREAVMGMARMDLAKARLPEQSDTLGDKKPEEVVAAQWSGLIEYHSGRLRWIPSDHG